MFRTRFAGIYITRQPLAPLPAALWVQLLARVPPSFIIIVVVVHYATTMHASDPNRYLLSICTLWCDIGMIARESKHSHRTIDLQISPSVYCTTVK